ncbi:MAG: 2-phospho-L-lactate transferase [Chloroflexi bacterium]|nr:MAG: 2-phospho-L-lactate transferase [Chloroflexota bacterium]MBL1195959.1 2-phospho-L-lactate transferase [Chloroflexota bacterium]NOH13253.1 2-phospho-L-lactate transferase [Chloroflexota bacterium]
MKVVALAGGVGGAKLAHGLALAMPSENLTIVVNTGDDFEHFGLKISPDLDTVCYTLAGLANPETGWGRVDESWNAMDSVSQLGGANWFNLGDRDLGTHLERTRRLNLGHSLSQITTDFCEAWGIAAKVLPMSDDTVPTIVITDEGELPFQEYFVARRCEPQVSAFRFEGVEQAAPVPGILEAIEATDVVIFCPSNPWVSIDPILALPGLRKAMADKPVVAVSPIIGGQAVKGPAAKMYTELGIEPSALAVAQHYQNELSGFVFDSVDERYYSEIESTDIQPLVTNTLMKSVEDRQHLAEEVLRFCEELLIPSGVGSG